MLCNTSRGFGDKKQSSVCRNADFLKWREVKQVELSDYMKGMNSYYQTLAAGGGLTGNYLWGSGSIFGGYPTAMLSAGMTSAAAPVYARFTEALQKAADERSNLSDEEKQEIQDLLKKNGPVQYPFYTSYAGYPFYAPYLGYLAGGGNSQGEQGDSADVSRQQTSGQLNMRLEQNTDSTLAERQGSLADRLASNRAARLSERMSQRQSHHTWSV